VWGQNDDRISGLRSLCTVEVLHMIRVRYFDTVPAPARISGVYPVGVHAELVRTGDFTSFVTECT